jgi:hypothetical protein
LQLIATSLGTVFKYFQIKATSNWTGAKHGQLQLKNGPDCVLVQFSPWFFVSPIDQTFKHYSSLLECRTNVIVFPLSVVLVPGLLLEYHLSHSHLIIYQLSHCLVTCFTMNCPGSVSVVPMTVVPHPHLLVKHQLPHSQVC